ncbi:DNA-3-methyladenine glycosylase [Alkalihalobacillus sp. AL-G]|uniref:DNA-3-methyladenine glycosylase n=1 Tax=Alkalihalobacillus sp. AL-G TaxID=2926399 RepID=UPI00272BB096|nr:DNA-3-methyladenine glycosylase [Alkalihalobacillus sp. AL-G]WLD92468.1 DNA-3-methyladenine glycosylase [Alkalihalobacillus sp. AL-G]
MKLSKSFYEQPTLQLAKELLGKEVIYESENGQVGGRIVEVEAYKGPEDKAAHSFGGRRTTRTEIMFGPPGFIYMFLIYGMHNCFNIVSGPEGKPEAILIRAIEPTIGVETMLQNRFPNVHTFKNSHLKTLTNGPGKLCKALGITMKQYGWSLTNSPVMVTEGTDVYESEISIGPRINIDYAGEHIHLPWRFWITDNAFVSK